jgi:hypothetical protein
MRWLALLILSMLSFPVSAQMHPCIAVADFALVARALVVVDMSPQKQQQTLALIYRDPSLYPLPRILENARQSKDTPENYSEKVGVMCFQMGEEFFKEAGQKI